MYITDDVDHTTGLLHQASSQEKRIILLDCPLMNEVKERTRRKIIEACCETFCSTSVTLIWVKSLCRVGRTLRCLDHLQLQQKRSSR